MLPARSLVRASRVAPNATRAATRQATRQHPRFQSTTTNTSSASSGSSTHFAAGLAGGVAGAGMLYGIYLITPAGKMTRKVNSTMMEANKKYQEASKKLQEKTPDADQTVQYIKDFCYSYVAWIPGGRAYVDTAFKDLDTIRENHKEEADQILNDAYKKFQALSKSGLSMDSASQALEILADLSKQVGNLAGDALGDVINNHPQLKEKFGGSIDYLKQVGDQYGPEAKKKIDETWSQVKEILAGGLTVANLDKARKLVEEKVEQVKKFGDEAWKKGLEQAKPYLDKNPKIKELVEKNADALKQGNFQELFQQAKKAAESGDLGGLEKYVQDAVNKAQSKGSKVSKQFGLDQYFDMIPEGSAILPKLKELKEVAEKHADEGEKLLKETMEEVKKVLENKAEKAKKIANKAKEESKDQTK